MKQCPNCKRKYFDDETNYCLNCRYPLKRIDGTNNDSREQIMDDFRHKNNKIFEHKPAPKCPTCQSTNIKKISSTKRWLSTGLFGLASSDLGKTMSCKSCGYKW